MARRDKADNPLGKWLEYWQGSTSFLGMCALLLFISVGAFLLWSHYGSYVLSQSAYQLSAESFEATPQPGWIVRSNVTAESVTAGGLSGLSIRQKDLAVVVGQTFRMHPWVRTVNHVTKRHPARVLVELTYRQPVAMVEVPGGRLPVDDEGILLPTADFNAETANQYLRIAAGESTPVSNLAGTAWGDERVQGAARVAAFLAPHHKRFGLAKITAYRGAQRVPGKSDLYYVIRSIEGTTVIWGRSPGEERSGEPDAEQKLTRLAEYIQKQGGLVVEQPGQTIDLRRVEGLKIATLCEEVR